MMMAVSATEESVVPESPKFQSGVCPSGEEFSRGRSPAVTGGTPSFQPEKKKKTSRCRWIESSLIVTQLSTPSLKCQKTLGCTPPKD
ncbi:hypothetical protein DNTS_031868 [Danionella cerebrum]|uniref:Uncharacterized protein n=1 Tax=Danionella cerebrum TaxID=2873325 RepID=A0A553RGN2_9TELE|nr:hypothetical protein DNTS_031868 [Danionella translucida]